MSSGLVAWSTVGMPHAIRLYMRTTKLYLMSIIAGLTLSAAAAVARAYDAGPSITIDRPSWAFSDMSIPNEPTMPCLMAWVDFVEDDRMDSLMTSVNPFSPVSTLDPFEE